MSGQINGLTKKVKPMAGQIDDLTKKVKPSLRSLTTGDVLGSGDDFWASSTVNNNYTMICRRCGDDGMDTYTPSV